MPLGSYHYHYHNYANSSLALSLQAGLVNPVFRTHSFCPNSPTALCGPPGFSPIPAKLVSQIASGEFAELSELLASNHVSSEPKPQLLFDGHLIFTSAPKKAKKRNFIKDIVSWMEAFTFFPLVFGNSFSASLERLVTVFVYYYCLTLGWGRVGAEDPPAHFLSMLYLGGRGVILCAGWSYLFLLL